MRRRDIIGGVVGAIAISAGGFRAYGKLRAGDESLPYRSLGRVALADAKEAVVAADGNVAFVAVSDGIASVDVSDPAEPTVLTEERDLFAEHTDGPMEQLWDVSVDGDRLIVAGPANPAGDALQGFVLYDVSDPAAPTRAAFHRTDFPIHNACIRDGLVYLTGNDGDREPLVAVDVTDDRPEEVGRRSLLDHDAAWGDVDARLRWLHDVQVRDGVAYLSHWDAGTWIVDVRDPADPTYVGTVGGRSIDELSAIPPEDVSAESVTLPGNHHFATVNDAGTILGINKEAWATDADGSGTGPGGVELWDVRDPSAPKHLTTIEPPPTPDPTYGVSPMSVTGSGPSNSAGAAHIKCHDCGSPGGGVWTTSHNFALVGDRLFTSWYQGGVKIHDVSDPAAPAELAWWREPDETSFWTAQGVDDSTFVASSMGWHGDGKGAIYTFPNRPGRQEAPPSLTKEDTST